MKQRMPKHTKLLIGLLAVGPVLVFMAMWFSPWWPCQNCRHMIVSWERGAQVRTVTGVVLDARGQAVQGQQILLTNHSGSSETWTDHEGRFSLQLTEGSELLELEVVDRDSVTWPFVQGVNYEDGLHFLIRLK